MRYQAYQAYAGNLLVTVATPRPEASGSAVFTYASIHEDYCAQVRVVLQEQKHILDSSQAYPAAQRLENYFPQPGGNPIYALRQLMPAGTPRSIDQDFQLEIMQIRYRFMIVLLPAAFQVDQRLVSGMERNLEKAVKDLFQANSLPWEFIPGDSGIRDEASAETPIRSEIDIICEMGPALEQGRVGVDGPQPV